MKIFRGPAGQPFEFTHTPNVKMFCGNGHEAVDEIDLASFNTGWHGVTVIKARIDKDASERSSVIHIVLEDKDIIALHKGLVDGLLESRRNADEASCEMTRLDLLGGTVGVGQNELSKSLSKVYNLIR